MFSWLTGSAPRPQRVAVGVVYDSERKKFLVVFNPRWRGYTFPQRRLRLSGACDPLRERENAEHEARRALLRDLGPTLGQSAEAHWLDRIEVLGLSGRTGRQTLYVYDIVRLVPARPLPDGGFAAPFGFLSAEEIRDSDPDEPATNGRVVTWTAWQVLTRLLDNQHAAVAIVCRENAGVREYLMTQTAYGQWFFPAGRMGDQVSVERLVRYEFTLKADYHRRIDVADQGIEVELEQNTLHLGPRNYTFHLRKTCFPQEDLTGCGNQLEAALDAAHIPFCWVSESNLSRPGMNISDTAAALRKAVLQLGCCET